MEWTDNNCMNRKLGGVFVFYLLSFGLICFSFGRRLCGTIRFFSSSLLASTLNKESIISISHFYSSSPMLTPCLECFFIITPPLLV